jgi:TPP-dependent pyruvate/acetoin dehydrogenase alpha subunit
VPLVGIRVTCSASLEGWSVMGDELLDLFREALLIRRLEERLMELKLEGQIPGSIHLCVGEEAIPVGACRVLQDGDIVTSTYRGHGWAIARGIDPADIFAEIMGRDSPLCGGRAGSLMFSSARHGFLGENSIVGGGVPVALGSALASRYRRDGRVTVAAIGDGALNQGAVHEALNFAAAFALPLVVVVENNLYSEMTPVRNMVNINPLSARAMGYGMPGETIDGNDVYAVIGAAGSAVERARGGKGPSLVEATTERLVGHYSGDLQHYRPAGEIERARRSEPLVRMRTDIARLVPDGGQLVGTIEAEVMERVGDAELRALAMPWPDPSTVKRHLYA